MIGDFLFYKKGCIIMKKTNNISIKTITDIDTLRNQAFLIPVEVGNILRIGENSLYAFLASDECPFPVYRMSSQIIRIPSKAFWNWYDGLAL